ncbi:hypothetical protein GEMRC1_008113 [Eukaryota sp. GEM-RC1]
MIEMGETFFSASKSSDSVPISFAPIDELKPEFLFENAKPRQLVFEERYQPAELPFVPTADPLPQDPQDKPVYHKTPEAGVTFSRAASEFLENGKVPNDLFLLQLPVSLPCESSRSIPVRKAPPTTPIQAKRKQQASEKEVNEARKNGAKKIPKQFEPFPTNHGDSYPSHLSSAPSGRLGKLVIHRSGKMRLVFEGGISFNLSQGIPVSFDERVVSISAKQREDVLESSTMVELGKVGCRMVGVIDV